MKKPEKYTLIVGLEVHVELTTKQKMFCHCPADHFNKPANTQTCPTCLGMPGTLPVPNREALESSVMIAKALNCEINEEFIFARKHYFYPDLPKGYQITQFQNPVGSNGFLMVNDKKIRINRVHIEEDTGRLIHEDEGSLIDFNRAGLPLVEIVTEADFNSWEDVLAYSKELQLIIKSLGVSDAEMQKGQMRFEPNISLTTKKGKLPPYKVEVKNINSFKFVKKAIIFETERQKKILDKGIYPEQETRGYSALNEETFSQRSKENAAQYKYFPEPDIPPVVFSKSEIERIFTKIPILPKEMLKMLKETYGLKDALAKNIIKDKNNYTYYVDLMNSLPQELAEEAPRVASWLVNKKINISMDHNLVIKMLDDLINAEPINSEELAELCSKIIKENEKLVTLYKSGKKEIINVLIGKAMKASSAKYPASDVHSFFVKILS